MRFVLKPYTGFVWNSGIVYVTCSSTWYVCTLVCKKGTDIMNLHVRVEVNVWDSAGNGLSASFLPCVGLWNINCDILLDTCCLPSHTLFGESNVVYSELVTMTWHACCIVGCRECIYTVFESGCRIAYVYVCREPLLICWITLDLCKTAYGFLQGTCWVWRISPNLCGLAYAARLYSLQFCPSLVLAQHIYAAI